MLLCTFGKMLAHKLLIFAKRRRVEARLVPRTFRHFQYLVCHHFPAPGGQKWTFFVARPGTRQDILQQSTGDHGGPKDFGALVSSGRVLLADIKYVIVRKPQYASKVLSRARAPSRPTLWPAWCRGAQEGERQQGHRPVISGNKGY